MKTQRFGLVLVTIAVVVVGIFAIPSVRGSLAEIYRDAKIKLGLATSYERIVDARDSLVDGNYALAQSEAQALLSHTDPTSVNYFPTLILLADTTYSTASTSADRAEAVRIAKDAFNAPGISNVQKAIAANKMISFAFETHERPVLDELYKDAPFAELKKGSSYDANLRELIAYSISLAPTSKAYTLKARIAANEIIDNLEIASTTVRKDVTRTQMQRLVSEAIGSITDAEAHLKNERSDPKWSPFEVTIEPWFQFWKGSVLSAVARADKTKTLVAEAEAALGNAEHAYETDLDIRGNKQPILESIAARAHITHARLIAATAGKARAEDVRVHLDAFTGMLVAHPELHKNFYNFFAYAKNPNQEASGRVVRSRQSADHVEYIYLARFSRAFSDFLEGQGWNLAQ